MKLKKGDFIKALDEDYVYQIQGMSTLSFGDTYMAKSISNGHTRGFDVDATHYRLATDQEVEDELKYAPKHYPFWITNKKDVIISSGNIFAVSFERAKEIFNQKLIMTNNVGQYNLSDKPLVFIE